MFFIFTPIPGEMIQFDEHIFQMGWNHQLVNILNNDEPPPGSRRGSDAHACLQLLLQLCLGDSLWS